MIKYKFPGEATPREIVAIHHKSPGEGVKTIAAVYRKVGGAVKLLWEIINSCFGSGYWVNNKPWKNTDSWKNLP